MEPSHLFTDPFASAVAGSGALKKALASVKPWPQAASPNPAAPAAGNDAAAVGEAGQHLQEFQRRFCFSNVAVRVWWFDQQLLAALSAAAPAPTGSSQPQPPRQVVVLGAGFDSRPWRMDLPPGVTWYEVDQSEVVAAKQEQLTQLGAGFKAAAAAAAASGGAASCRHPLRAASWTALAADLGQQGWAGQLLERGLDSSRPVVWVLEGLLMYLEPEQVAALLAEMAGETESWGWGWAAHGVCHACIHAGGLTRYQEQACFSWATPTLWPLIHDTC